MVHGETEEILGNVARSIPRRSADVFLQIFQAVLF